MSFDQILHKPWEPGDNPDEIIHHWAEDDSIATLKVPEQLRESILELQNRLSCRYIEAEKHEAKARKIRTFLQNI